MPSIRPLALLLSSFLFPAASFVTIALAAFHVRIGCLPCLSRLASASASNSSAQATCPYNLDPLAPVVTPQRLRG
jgi:hypothetical protein